jgi:hypothetical protein
MEDESQWLDAWEDEKDLEEFEARQAAARAAKPPSAPLHVQVLEVTKTSIKLSWLPPIDADTGLTGYRISLQRELEGDEHLDPEYADLLTTRPLREYANNRDKLTQMWLQKYFPKASHTASDSAAVERLGGGLKSPRGEVLWATVELPVDAQEGGVGGLSRGVRYVATVAAANAMGFGTESRVVEFRTERRGGGMDGL